MGCFSWTCAKSNLPICSQNLGYDAAHGEIVVIAEDGIVIRGAYDGYGHVLGTSLYELEAEVKLVLVKYYDGESYDELGRSRHAPCQGTPDYQWLKEAHDRGGFERHELYLRALDTFNEAKKEKYLRSLRMRNGQAAKLLEFRFVTLEAPARGYSSAELNHSNPETINSLARTLDNALTEACTRHPLPDAVEIAVDYLNRLHDVLDERSLVSHDGRVVRPAIINVCGHECEENTLCKEVADKLFVPADRTSEQRVGMMP